MDRKTTLFENQPAPKQPFDRFPVPIGPSDMKLGMQIGDGIIAALAPKYKPKPRVGKCTIMEMDFEVTTDAIQVTLDLIDDQDNDHTDIILVDHKPFLQFLEDGFYLDRDGGSHEIVGGD